MHSQEALGKMYEENKYEDVVKFYPEFLEKSRLDLENSRFTPALANTLNYFKMFFNFIESLRLSGSPYMALFTLQEHRVLSKNMYDLLDFYFPELHEYELIAYKTKLKFFEIHAFMDNCEWLEAYDKCKELFVDFVRDNKKTNIKFSLFNTIESINKDFFHLFSLLGLCALKVNDISLACEATELNDLGIEFLTQQTVKGERFDYDAFFLNAAYLKTEYLVHIKSSKNLINEYNAILQKSHIDLNKLSNENKGFINYLQYRINICDIEKIPHNLQEAIKFYKLANLPRNVSGLEYLLVYYNELMNPRLRDIQECREKVQQYLQHIPAENVDILSMYLIHSSI